MCLGLLYGVEVAAEHLVTGLRWKASARAEATVLWRCVTDLGCTCTEVCVMEL